MFQVKESLTMIEEFLINVPSDMIVYEIILYSHVDTHAAMQVHINNFMLDGEMIISYFVIDYIITS